MNEWAVGLFEKEEFELELVEKMREVVTELKEQKGVNVTSATVITNTTGTVNVND